LLDHAVVDLAGLGIRRLGRDHLDARHLDLPFRRAST
jgi:hypothetical protein